MSGREIIADPLNKKKKIELRQGGTHRQIASRGCDPLQRGTFLRRAGEWPILGTSPASAPSEDDEKVGGRFSGGSIPGGYGKSPFSLDCTYHGCPLFVGASLAAAPQPLFCWIAGSMKNCNKSWLLVVSEASLLEMPDV